MPPCGNGQYETVSGGDSVNDPYRDREIAESLGGNPWPRIVRSNSELVVGRVRSAGCLLGEAGGADRVRDEVPVARDERVKDDF
jgi:hypothetical protein